MSAWVSQNHMVLGQTRTAAHSNEITAIPKLVSWSCLELPGVAMKTAHRKSWSCWSCRRQANSRIRRRITGSSAALLPWYRYVPRPMSPWEQAPRSLTPTVLIASTACLGVAWSCVELQGCIITIDAMGCQKDIAQQIVDGGYDYLLAIKSNQGKLYGNIKEVFECSAR